MAAAAGSVDSQQLERIISNYEQQTEQIRELQKQAVWGAVAQVSFILADDVLFFVRRSFTIVAFDPIYIAAALVGLQGARKMIPVYMISHMVLNVAVTLIILLHTTLQAIFGYDDQRSIVLMYVIRIPLLAAVACAIPTWRLYSAVSRFRRSAVGQDMTNSMLESAVGSVAPPDASTTRRNAQEAGAMGLARARSEAGLPREASNEMPGIRSEYL